MNQPAPYFDDPQWIGLFDKDNEKSVYARSPKRLQEAMDEIPDHVRSMEEEELLHHTNPSGQLCAIRQKFWAQVEESDKKIRISDLFKHRTSFYYMIQDSHKLMWFLTPPPDFLSTQKSILERSLTTLHKFISGDHMWTETRTIKTGKDGETTETVKKEINIKAVDQARKIMEAMTDRIHGSVAMHMKIQGQHVHAAVTPEAQLLQMDPSKLLDIAADEPPVVIDPDAPPPRLAKSYVDTRGDGTPQITKETTVEEDLAVLMDDDPTD